MKIRLFLLSFATMFTASIAAPSASASTAPVQELEATINRVIDVLFLEKGQSVEYKRDKILGILNERFSFEIMVKSALGRNRGKLSQDQLDQVILLATDLLIRSYTKEFSNSDRPIVKFAKTKELSTKKIEAPSTVTIDGKPVNLAYRLAKLKDGWQVYDVLVEGVSLVRSYREQFDEHFQKKDGDDLISLLESKLEES